MKMYHAHNREQTQPLKQQWLSAFGLRVTASFGSARGGLFMMGSNFWCLTSFVESTGWASCPKCKVGLPALLPAGESGIALERSFRVTERPGKD